MADPVRETTEADELNHRQTQPATGTVGLLLFLASLTMLFGASLVAYAIIRFRGAQAPPPGTLTIPNGFWISTLVILASGVSMQRAVHAVRDGRLSAFRVAIVVTMVLGVLFLIIQGPCLYRLYQVHHAAQQKNVFLHGLALLLIGLHALHVVGGIIPLALVTSKAMRGDYSDRQYRGVRNCAIYWHFLDVVWVIMFAVLLLTA